MLKKHRKEVIDMVDNVILYGCGRKVLIVKVRMTIAHLFVIILGINIMEIVRNV
jgi:hypothetical protein